MVTFLNFANAPKNFRTYSVIMFVYMQRVCVRWSGLYKFSLLRDLKLSQQYCWRFKLCGIWHRVNWYTVTDVSEFSATKFRTV